MMGGWKCVWKNMFLVFLTQKHANELKLFFFNRPAMMAGLFIICL